MSGKKRNRLAPVPPVWFEVQVGEALRVRGEPYVHKVASWGTNPRIYGVGEVPHPELRAITVCGLETERMRQRYPKGGKACPGCYQIGRDHRIPGLPVWHGLRLVTNKRPDDEDIPF